MKKQLVFYLNVKQVKAISFYVLFTFSFLEISGQLETAKWYFSYNAGLDFTTNPPTALVNGALNTGEGSATISDPLGNLIIYTDGITIWNSSHTVIPNGNGLTGDPSTTQSAIIIKKPGSSSIFYVFTQGVGLSSPLNCSTVDMSLAGGSGSVTVKNALIYSNSTEKLTAVNHCNGVDVWVLSHKSNSADFHAYLVSASGVNTVPVVSTTGSSNAWYGYLKISPNGRKALSATGGTNTSGSTVAFEVLDFDNSTGIFSNAQAIQTGAFPYGCEFSPDGTKIYGTTFSTAIYQWDICAGSASAIAASVYTFSTPSPQKLALQLAINGKIYVARDGQKIVGVINNPNVAGVGCNYVDLGQSLSTRTCGLGLPNFNASYFKTPPPDFSIAISPTLNCMTASFSSSPTPTVCGAAGYTASGISWLFGDPGSGTANTSTLTNPSHVFSGPGTYTVKQIFYNLTCAADTARKVLVVSGSIPSLTVAPGFSICTGQTVILSAGGADSYTWSNAGTKIPSSTITVSPTISTTYTLVATSTVNNCSQQKTVSVTVSKCIGIEEIEPILGIIKIYPNPGNGTFHIESLGNYEGEIYDVAGAKIKSVFLKVGSNLLDLSASQNGIYFLKILGQKKGGVIIKNE